MFQTTHQGSSERKANQTGPRPNPPVQLGNQAMLRRLQAKLAVSQPGDPAELEADRVADQVMRMPEPVISRKCAECEEEDAHKLQAKNNGQQRTETTAPPIVHEALNAPGQPLGHEERAFFESRFGADFGQVRIHTGDAAAESARAVNALAYTVGNDLVFDSGRYDPGSAQGRRLLAHELTHSVQQRSCSSPSLFRDAAPAGTCDPTNLGALGPMFHKDPSEVAKMGLPKATLSTTKIEGDDEFAFYCSHRASVKLRDLAAGSALYLIGSGKARGKDEVWAQPEGNDDYYWGFTKSGKFKKADSSVGQPAPNASQAPVAQVAGVNVLSIQVTRAMAEAMRDDQLSQQMDILRNHLEESPNDTGAAENLSVLEGVAYERQGTARQSPSPAATSGQPVPDGAIAGMSSTDKLLKAYEYAQIAQELRAQLAQRFGLKQLVIMIYAGIGVFIASQFTPVGWIADIGVVLTAAFVGKAMLDAIHHLAGFAAAAKATTDAELHQAGDEFAKAVAGLQIDAFMLILTLLSGGAGGAGRAASTASKAAAPVGDLVMVGADGVIIGTIPAVKAAETATVITSAQAAQLGFKGTVLTSAMMSQGPGGQTTSGQGQGGSGGSSGSGSSSSSSSGGPGSSGTILETEEGEGVFIQGARPPAKFTGVAPKGSIYYGMPKALQGPTADAIETLQKAMQYDQQALSDLTTIYYRKPMTANMKGWEELSPYGRQNPLRLLFKFDNQGGRPVLKLMLYNPH